MDDRVINEECVNSSNAPADMSHKQAIAIEPKESVRPRPELASTTGYSSMMGKLEDLKHIKNYYDVYAFKKAHPIIKKLKADTSQPKIHGHKFWDSSLLLMDYLENNPIEKKSRVMELGCGWGLLSIFCAKAFKAKVTGVDADPNVFPFLDVHAALNGVSIKNKASRFETLKKSKLAKQDFILGADICFWDELSQALYQTINKAKKHGDQTILIADPGRSPFLKLAKKCERKYGAELVEWNIHYPKRVTGYLLVMEAR